MLSNIRSAYFVKMIFILLNEKTRQVYIRITQVLEIKCRNVVKHCETRKVGRINLFPPLSFGVELDILACRTLPGSAKLGGGWGGHIWLQGGLRRRYESLYMLTLIYSKCRADLRSS